MSDSTPIAIVGMGGLFPGAPDYETFWANIVNGRNAASEPPEGRWLVEPDAAFDERKPHPDRVYSRRACFIRELPPWPESNYSLQGVDGAQLDPLYHVLLHAGHRAWRDAKTADLNPQRVGVILGNLALPTEKASALAREYLGGVLEEKLLGRNAHANLPTTSPLNRYVTGFPAALLAQSLGVEGGSYTLDAACASSLYAIRLAMDELRAGRLDAALSGGVSRPDSLYTQMGFSQLRALSPTGVCSPFDAKGNGLVVGEGAGVFVLKRLDDAIAQGDRIRGVIRSVGLSNDVGGSLLAPQNEGQLRAMRAAYAEAGIDPSEIDLVECHATGTPLGDATEVESLRRLWGAGGWTPGQCVIGSVKSNIGHLLTAAGSAALTKVLLALQEETLPPTAHFAQPAPGVTLDDSPFEVLTRPQPWAQRADGKPRRAAVSAFGFGGINAHMLIEEWRERETAPAAKTSPIEISSAPCPVAVVGMDAHYGPWITLRAFQERVFGAGHAADPAPPNRWWGVEHSAWFAAAGLKPDHFLGHYIGELDIPRDRFRIPPREIEEMLPQQLLALKLAAGALDDCHTHANDDSLRERTGVYLGIGLDLNTTNYSVRWGAEANAKRWAETLALDMDEAERAEWIRGLLDATGPALSANRTMGGLASVAASRIAREFRLGGPSYTVSSEDTSSLRAIELAVRALQTGQVDRAVASGVDFAGDPRAAIARRLAGGPSDAPIGEGGAALVLKRLDDARRDGDRVYAVITDINTQISASNSNGLEQRIGDAGAAAGIARFVAGCLSIYQEILPASQTLGPTYWLRDRVDGPRRIDIGQHGFDGNALRIGIEEYPDHADADTAAERAQPLGASPEALFVLEGNGTAALDVALTRLHRLTEQQADDHIETLARHWWTEHTPDPAKSHAVTLVARSPRELFTLIDYAHGRLAKHPDKAFNGTEASGGTPATHERAFFSPEPLGPDADVAFVYPGSGNQYAGMGRDLGLRWPEVFRRQDAESERLQSQIRPDIFWTGENAAELNNHQAALFGQVTLGTAFTDLVSLFGIRPDAVIGYSLGETAGLFSMRAWTNRDEMLERVRNSTLFTEDLAGEFRAARKAWNLPGQQKVDWALGVIDRPAKVVRAAIKDHKKVYNLIVNTLQECVVGGDPHAVEKLVKKLDCEFFPLQGVTTVHCEVAKEVQEPYRALHVLPTTPPKGVRFYSGAWGTAYNVSEDTAADAVLAQAIYGIDYPKLIDEAYKDGARIFIEMGPGASCSRMIADILNGRPHMARSIDAPGQDTTSRLLRLLARLGAERVSMDLSVLYGRETRVDAHQQLADQSNTITLHPGGAPIEVKLPVLPQGRPNSHVHTNAVTAASKPEPLPGGSSSTSTGPTPAPSPAKPQPVTQPAPRTTAPRPPAPTPRPMLEPVAAGVSAEPAAAHAAFLRLSEKRTAVLAEAIAFQMNVAATLGEGDTTFDEVAPPFDFTPPQPPKVAEASSLSPQESVDVASPSEIALDRNQCMEFAIGSIAKVLGEAFAEADTYPTRVRLPDEPLMLADRIVEIHGDALSMTHGRVVTEHDVLPGTWYLDAGRIPTCIAVEAGQADLFLSGYLGIDLQTRGLAMYRLLDAAITFHAALPQPGDTIRYDIRIERFFRQGDTWLFRFNFDATVNGTSLLTMRNGCAGFFTRKELDAGVGVVRTELDKRPRPGTLPDDWTWPLEPQRESFDDAQITALRKGDLASAFGEPFANLPLRAPSGLPGGRMKLIDRVREIEPGAGRYGLGVIRGEMDIQPDDWFLTCHFIDDQVMPGTLMYECCLHTLRVFLMRIGWVGEADRIVYEPVPGVTGQLKCRGEVNATSKRVMYEVEIRELGYNPNAYAIADTLMYVDGKPAVEMAGMSLQLTGLSREDVDRLWSGRKEETNAAPAIYDYDKILAFSQGNPSDAFGEPYRIFDHNRVIARLPRPPFQFLDRITVIDHAQWEMTAGGAIEAEYDVPADAWYFDADRANAVPFAVLLEAGLQPCGWFAAYMGSALQSDVDVKFRNLGGRAVQHRSVGRDIGTLRTRVKCTAVSHSAGMIIQHYRFDMTANGEPVYSGDTYFGYFSAKALENQVGIREAQRYEPSPAECAAAASEPYPREAPFPDAQWRMVERVDHYAATGGPHGLGFVRGSVEVDPSRWFFEAHFYQDPVWPGSLGLESFLQLLKFAAVERWRDTGKIAFEILNTGNEHSWIYRGQVIPRDKHVTIDAAITAIDDDRKTMKADGFLVVDGRVIYQMGGFEIRLVDGPE